MEIAKPKKKRPCPPHFTREHQRRARSKVSSQSCAINGAKGYKATLAKHGPDVAFNAARQWRLDHPSSNELRMIGILSQLGIEYKREHRLGESQYTIDFYLPETGQAIEVDSRIHTQFDVERRQRQAAKKENLLKEHQIGCLTIWDVELNRKDLSPVIEKIKNFTRARNNIKGCGQTAQNQGGNR